MSPELVNVLFQVSRWFFAFLGVFAVLSALGWLHAEKKSRRERLRSIPAAGTVGELMVLAGSDELPVQTWFPVVREGVLGSVRSCDLVVPCPGVKAHHLDFCWKDGVGLIVHPRSGCEALVDGILLDCRSDALSHPLTHGACLQVGDAILRLQVLKALDHTYVPAVSETIPFSPSPGFVSGMAIDQPQPEMMQPVDPSPVPYESGYVPDVPPSYMPPYFPGYISVSSDAPSDISIPAAPEEPVQTRRRSDGWREDWSE